MDRKKLETNTGKLFEKLWAPDDTNLFEHSVSLFLKRLEILNFDTKWFLGKTVLDAGCGGGRNAIAMARLGAKKASGIDLGSDGILDAKKRSETLNNIEFQVSSIQDIPYPDETFNMVWCAGVLMITDDENQALDELTRVLKSQGMLYLLVYATEGIRWPLIQILRPISQTIGQEDIELSMENANMPANKRRTFLDDLFCPKLDFYTWERLIRMLEKRGFKNIFRFPNNARLDHEHSLSDYKKDLESLLTIFSEGTSRYQQTNSSKSELFKLCQDFVSNAVSTVNSYIDMVDTKVISENEAMIRVIGQGHHRIFAEKS